MIEILSPQKLSKNKITKLIFFTIHNTLHILRKHDKLSTYVFIDLPFEKLAISFKDLEDIISVQNK